MFNYDKLIKKLNKFEDLSNKKQRKTLDIIFKDEEFHKWLLGLESDCDQPMTKQMVDKLFAILESPKLIKAVTSYIENNNYEEFDRMSRMVGWIMVDNCIQSSNDAILQVDDDYKAGSVDNKTMKEFRQKAAYYSEYVEELMNALKEKSKYDVKDISNKSNLPKNLIYNMYFIMPPKKYIPKHKILMYMSQLLKEIYTYTGDYGMDSIESIKWGPCFGSFFGNELTTSSAIAILLEGVRRIDSYRETDYFSDVRDVWDSLTNFALNELNNAPENLRRQMLEIYIKRLSKMYSNGNSPILRVDILNLPNEFSNLTNTIRRYSDRIEQIVGNKPLINNNSNINGNNNNNNIPINRNNDNTNNYNDRKNNNNNRNNNNNQRSNNWEDRNKRFNKNVNNKMNNKDDRDDDDDDELDPFKNINSILKNTDITNQFDININSDDDDDDDDDD